MEEGPKLLLPCSFSSLESFTSLLRETLREQGNKVLFTRLAQEITMINEQQGDE
jgi:hypothetical protein